MCDELCIKNYHVVLYDPFINLNSALKDVTLYFNRKTGEIVQANDPSHSTDLIKIIAAEEYLRKQINENTIDFQKFLY